MTEHIVKLCCGSLGRKPREDGCCRNFRGLDKKTAGFPGASRICTSKTWIQINHFVRYKLIR